jgi:arginine deiminase
MENRKWGVISAYGDLESVLMHRPGVELDVVNDQNLDVFNFDAPVNRDVFVAEYDAMVSQFNAHGVECVFLTDILKDDEDSINFIKHRPNMTYTRDLAAVFHSGAVLLGPKLLGRWGDQDIVGRALKRMGIPILGSIDCPHFLEGGGVTMIGEDTVVASICDRANQSGTKALRDLILCSEVEYFLEVPLPPGHIHIDGLYMTLDENLAIAHLAPLNILPCRLFKAGEDEPRHIMFSEYLELRNIKVIEIDEQEMRGGHLNLVVTNQSKKAIGFECASRLGLEMAKYGWQVSTFPSDTLFKGNGGAHCMTMPLHVT